MTHENGAPPPAPNPDPAPDPVLSPPPYPAAAPAPGSTGAGPANATGVPTPAPGPADPSPAPPSYPVDPPAYPATAAPPPYPAATSTADTPPAPPQHPGAPPTYPTTAAPAGYPAAPHGHPGAAAAPPPYPRTAVPPQYPGAPPAGPPPPSALPPGPGHPGLAQHEHHINTDQRRAHIRAHPRGADATAVGSLLLYLPHFLCSLVVVGLFSLFFGDLSPVLLIAWLLSGLLVFHRPTESTIARRMLGLRRPLPEERARLDPVWREVAARAGVDADTYELWIEDTESLNAVAAAGHIVGVTRFALNHLPNGQLAAVLAHELGHHVGGHAWASLLGHWYALPARLTYRALRACAAAALRISAVLSCLGFAVIGMVILGVAVATISSLYGLPLLVLAAPYALAAVARRSELRADQHAAGLGFAPMLVAVLQQMHHAEQQQQQHMAAIAAAGGRPPATESPAGKLLSSHPDHHTRLHHLQPWLEAGR